MLTRIYDHVCHPIQHKHHKHVAWCVSWSLTFTYGAGILPYAFHLLGEAGFLLLVAVIYDHLKGTG